MSKEVPGASVVAALALVWLAVDLGVAFKTIDQGAIASTQVALFLPSLVVATLTAGAAIGVLTVGWLADRFGGSGRRRARIAAGAVGGVAVAVISAGGLLASYRGASVVAVAITLGVVAIGGGALAAVRPAVTIVAGVAGTLAYAAVSFVEAYFRDDLLNLFWDATTVGAYAAADSQLSLVVSIVTGTVAGLTAYIFIRRSGLTLPWPVYLAAGAVPGTLLLLAELASWLGGFSLRSAVGRFSEFDRLAVATLQPGRINHGMIVFFAGAVTAVILVGRTMRAVTPDDRAPTGRTTPTRGPRRRRR
jgi:MFS family permease